MEGNAVAHKIPNAFKNIQTRIVSRLGILTKLVVRRQRKELHLRHLVSKCGVGTGRMIQGGNDRRLSRACIAQNGRSKAGVLQSGMRKSLHLNCLCRHTQSNKQIAISKGVSITRDQNPRCDTFLITTSGITHPGIDPSKHNQKIRCDLAVIAHKKPPGRRIKYEREQQAGDTQERCGNYQPLVGLFRLQGVLTQAGFPTTVVPGRTF